MSDNEIKYIEQLCLVLRDKENEADRMSLSAYDNMEGADAGEFRREELIYVTMSEVRNKIRELRMTLLDEITGVYKCHVKFEEKRGDEIVVIAKYDSSFEDLAGAMEYMQPWIDRDFRWNSHRATEAWIEKPMDSGWIVYIGDQEMNDFQIV